MANRTRPIILRLAVTEQEKSLIEHKMKQLGTKNFGAYARKKLDELPPLDEASFKAKLNDIISAYTKGKDAATLRIVVKRRESED